ncbi:conserved hypothetical protein [Thermotomaculum hydrothermale]|uniref:Cation diffusion facilitator family transporter n=1 Tax=Thermotomaculum hydrothermale TaxID=981385 RepID=A0A7R6SXK8_9BACT|nr:cation diffusion facilitator family transporter [Thermotomaculum hydrothermale]BBB31904.1 conserved hypothetical protein [Thermotomaculum hydrothermale]
MNGFFEFLLKIFKIKENERKKIGYFEGFFSIFVNIVISVVKLFYGITLNSVSLIADAAHSISDVLSSIVVIIGFKLSDKPADKEHPFGHGRIDLIATVIISTMLLIVGFEFLKDAIVKIKNPSIVSSTNIEILIIASTILLKELLAQFSFFLGKKINSPSLIAEGHHHRSDALSTVIVIISLIGSNYGYKWIDGAAGLIVALFIMHTAIDLLKDAANPLIGSAPDREMVEEIKQIAMSYPEVIDVHDIVVHQFGEKWHISLHIEIPHTMNILEAHTLADNIERRIQSKYKGMTVVHIDPVNSDHPRYSEVKQFIKKLANKYPELKTAHDIRIVGDKDTFNILFDINLEETRENYEKLKEIRKVIAKKFNAGVVVNVDPPLS